MLSTNKLIIACFKLLCCVFFRLFTNGFSCLFFCRSRVHYTSRYGKEGGAISPELTSPELETSSHPNEAFSPPPGGGRENYSDRSSAYSTPSAVLSRCWSISSLTQNRTTSYYRKIIVKFS